MAYTQVSGARRNEDNFAFCILLSGIRTQAIFGALKNTLVWMLGDGKERAQGVAVVDLLRPAGLFCFSMDSAKIACFLLFEFYNFNSRLIKQF